MVPLPKPDLGPAPVPAPKPDFGPPTPKIPVEPLTPPATIPPPPTKNPERPPLTAPGTPLPAPATGNPSVLQPPVPAGTPGATVQEKPQPLPPPQAVTGRYVVLKDDKLIEGAVTLRGDVVVVRQGTLDRPFPKSQVHYVAESHDEVYKYMLARVPADDVKSRVLVARWCMLSGMREQALTEAREILKLQPTNADAASMVRSLELSLRQNPPPGAPKMTAPQPPTFTTDLNTKPALPAPVEPEASVTPEASNWFGARVQPFLANQCVGCHSAADYRGTFRLSRVVPGVDPGVEITRANLKAVAAQLRKDDPGSSPLLAKALVAHGGQRAPAVASKDAAAYKALEGWVAVAVGAPVMAPPAVPPMTPPAVPSLPPARPSNPDAVPLPALDPAPRA
ncbi:MAG: hypothetical protein K2V38_11545, partial [Gemmataceae bacterium]|nr:hypothetical protein [Gemmataceae bacterium]